jgi:hypothetical protein
MVLLISYDLNGHERPAAYAAVRRAIEKNALSYRRPLYSQWFIETNHNPDAWADMLREVMDDNDSLFVVRVTRPYQGWLTNADWNWINTRA